MSADPVKKLRSLAGEAPSETPQTIEGADPVLNELLYAFLLWEAGAKAAENALKRIRAEVVDANELRICTPDEIASVLGARYPRGKERGERFHACLNAIYEREHGLSMDNMLATPKREARTYLESLPGMPLFVAARVLLLAIGGHAFPVDDRLAATLAGLGIGEDCETTDELASWMERQVRAGESRELYLALEAASEKPARRAAPSSKSTKKKPARKSAASGRGGSKESAKKASAKSSKKPTSRSSKAAGKK